MSSNKGGAVSREAMEMTTELRIFPLDPIGRDRRLDLVKQVKQKAIICPYTADISVLVLLGPWLQEESAHLLSAVKPTPLGNTPSSRTYNLIQHYTSRA